MSKAKQLCDTDRSLDQINLTKLWHKILPKATIPTDKLETIVALQTAFLRHIYVNNKVTMYTRFSDPFIIQQTQYMIASIHNELEELRDWLPWKHHKKYPPDFKIDRGELKYEIMDCMHFLLNMCILWDMNAEEIYDYFLHKNLINWERQKYDY